MEEITETFIPTKWRARVAKDNTIELKFFFENNRTVNINLTMDQSKQMMQIFKEILGRSKQSN